jgi:SAM-dependent methyltransferase
VYRRVLTADVRTATFPREEFNTVFANSVLEHIPDLQGVLRAAYAALRPGGQLVTTVPLKEMNHHLLLQAHWYVNARQHQLVHRNLWSQSEWERALAAAGFAPIEWMPTLPPVACRRWDKLDALGALGSGRVRVGAIARRIGHYLAPQPVRDAVIEGCARRLRALYCDPGESSPCAALLVAHKA